MLTFTMLCRFHKVSLECRRVDEVSPGLFASSTSCQPRDVQVYTALQQRNTLGPKVHFLTSDTGDAAELIAGLGPRGEFNSGHTNLADLAVEMSRASESYGLLS